MNGGTRSVKSAGAGETRSSGQLASALSLELLANHFPALHGLRVLAIVTVVQVHVTLAIKRIRFLDHPEFFDYSKRVFFGMDLFFILSGFLIGTILLHSVESKTLRGVGRFYLRRGFRTFPLYYFVLTAMVLFWPLPPSRLANLGLEYAYLTNYFDLTFQSRVMHWGWSLAVEEHFYLVAPLFLIGLGLLRSHRARVALLLALWAAGLVVRFRSAAFIPVMTVGTELFGSMREIYVTSHNRFDILVAGILLAYLNHHFRDRIAALLARAPARWAAYAVSLGCLALLVFKPRLFDMDDMTFTLLSFGTLTSLMYAPLILVLVTTDGPLVRFLSRPVFLRLATLGYGIYLVHMPVCTRLIPLTRQLLTSTSAPFPLVWTGLLVATLVLAAAVAYLLHLAVEKPSLRLRDRLVPRRPD